MRIGRVVMYGYRSPDLISALQIGACLTHTACGIQLWVQIGRLMRGITIAVLRRVPAKAPVPSVSVEPPAVIPEAKAKSVLFVFYGGTGNA